MCNVIVSRTTVMRRDHSIGVGIRPIRSSDTRVIPLQTRTSVPQLGGDVFFTELYKVGEDGSTQWESDGGVAAYNPTAYETQRVTITSGSSGR